MLALDSLDAGLASLRLHTTGGTRYQGTPEQLLAELWDQLQPGGQRELFDDDTSTEIGVVAGYGSGKTTADCYKAIKLAMQNPGCVGAVLEPIYGMLEEIWFPKFEEVLDRHRIPFTFSRKSDRPEHVLHLPTGDATVAARAMEGWRRIVGPDWAWAIGDESDTIKTSEAIKAYKKITGRIRVGNVRQVVMTSTPEGFGFHYQTFGSEEAASVPGRRLIRMRSDDNKYLTPDYFERMERNYTVEELRAYRDGVYVNLATGSVWYKFDRAKHVKPVEFDPDDGETLILGCDFNIGNTNGIVQVKRGPVMLTIDEIRTHDTEQLCQEVRRRYPHATIHGYPDASGASRSTNSTRSDTNILAEYGIGNYSPKANPPVRDRVAVGNSRLENGKGEISIVIDPRCSGLIQDLERQCYDERGEPDKTNGNDHRPEAWSYPLHRIFAAGKPLAGPVRSVRLY